MGANFKCVFCNAPDPWHESWCDTYSPPTTDTTLLEGEK